MKPEIEVKFLNIDHDELRGRLKASGASGVQPMRLMKRAIIDYPDSRLQTGSDDFWGWVRVRDEGDKVTVTYKQVRMSGADRRSTHEIEYTASSYGQAVALFEAIGLTVHAYQETRRETWRLDDCLVELDEWPWLEPMMEIEGPDEKAVRAVAAKLALHWDEAWHGGVDSVYRSVYSGMNDNESIADMTNLTFDQYPDWLKEREAL
jgi:adenylate cyclase class 2